MSIKIVQRLKPFSHLPGTKCLVPGSMVLAEVFPTRLRLYDYSKVKPELKVELAFSLTKVIDFTVQADLEKGRIAVFGNSQEGFFRYWLHAVEGQELPALILNRFQAGLEPILGNPYQVDEKTVVFSQNPPQLALFSPKAGERIFLGVDKKQDWEHAMERMDPSELLPFLFRLGQLIPYQGKDLPHEGTFSLLHRCIEKNGSLERFRNLLLVGFESLLAPLATDESYRGFGLQPLVSKDLPSPLILATTGSLVIRNLFLQVEEEDIHLLPHLPASLNHGRFTQFSVGNRMTLDLIWKKRKPISVCINALEEGEYQFHFPLDIKRFRLRQKKHEKGILVDASQKLHFEAGRVYLLDKLQK